MLETPAKKNKTRTAKGEGGQQKMCPWSDATFEKTLNPTCSNRPAPIIARTLCSAPLRNRRAVMPSSRISLSMPKTGDPVLCLFRKRMSAVNGALRTIEGGLAFSMGGREVVMSSLDGREAHAKDATEIVSGPELCEKKLEDVVRKIVLRDKNARRTTKRQYVKTTKNMPAAAQKSVKNTVETARELH